MRNLILCFVLLLSFFDGAIAQVDKYKMELQHHLVFKDTVFNRVAFVNAQLDSIVKVSGMMLHRDVSLPKVVTIERHDFAVTFVIYNNTSIAGYDRDYAATAVDMLITFNGSVYGKLRFTRDFFLPVVEYKESLVKYDIRRIEKVDIRKDGVCIDVMLCIPDSDMDVYYRIICSGGSKFDLEDVCEEYWTDEEEI